MASENFQIYTVQITGKCICETFPPSLHDLIIRHHVKQSPHKFAQKHPSWKAFLREKRSSLTLRGEETLLYTLASFLTSVVQIMAFQSKTT